MTRARRFIITLAAAMLSGCWWEGPIFYQPDPAIAGPLEAGTYDLPGDDGKLQRTHIRHAGDGSYLDDDGDRIIFTPFDFPRRELWVSETISANAEDGTAVYGLVERRGPVLGFAVFLPCDDNESLVRSAGGTVKGDAQSIGGPLCVFADRTSLERALKAYLSRHPHLPQTVPLNRVGD